MAEDNELKNARQDDRVRKEYKSYEDYKKQEKEENEAPRKALGEAFDYVKGKVSKFGEDVKKGLGMKEGGGINLKNCKINTAESRNSKHKSW